MTTPQRKQIILNDTERLVILHDDKMKYVTMEKILLIILSSMLLVALTVYGLIVGINQEIIKNLFDDIDGWTSIERNQAAIVSVFLITLFVILIFGAIIWLIVRKKK